MVKSMEIIGYNKVSGLNLFGMKINLFVRDAGGREFKVQTSCRDIQEYPRGSYVDILVQDGCAMIV